MKITNTASTIRNLASLLVICIVCLGCGSVQSTTTSAANMPKANKQITSSTLPFKERWRWSGQIDEILAINNRIIVTNRDSKEQIIVFDAETGDILWESIPMANIRSIAADKDRVYIGTITNVQTFDLENGQKLWQGVEQPDLKRGGFLVNVRGDQVDVYDILEPRTYILDAVTGQVIEQISKNLFFRGNDINYSIIQGNYMLEARDAATDQRLWTYPFPGYIHGWPLEAGEILLQNARGQIYGIRATTGEVVWQTKATEKAYTHPQYVSSVALQDDLALVLRYDAAIVGFNPETGEQVGSIEMMPNRTMEDDNGTIEYYGIATSDRFVAVHYGNSKEMLVFEKLSFNQ